MNLAHTVVPAKLGDALRRMISLDVEYRNSAAIEAAIRGIECAAEAAEVGEEESPLQRSSDSACSTTIATAELGAALLSPVVPTPARPALEGVRLHRGTRGRNINMTHWRHGGRVCSHHGRL